MSFIAGKSQNDYFALTRGDGGCRVMTKLFMLSHLLQRNVPSKEKEPEVTMFTEKFYNRFTVSLQEFKMKLQANVADDGSKEIVDNVSYTFSISFFLCLYSTLLFSARVDGVHFLVNGMTLSELSSELR